jgi:O-antigen/teichoic acid export membrane protein
MSDERPGNGSNGGSDLARSAVHGGLWSMAQVVANKALALLGTLALMYLLAPGDYAIAGIALSIQAFLTLLAPFTLGDVLISRPREAERLMGTAMRVCLAVCAITAVLILAAGPLASREYGQSALVAACATAALRPAVELMLLTPHARMRLRLKFREMAMIDALTQTLATVTAIGMAWAGTGWVSLILPQIAFTGVRAWMCSRAAPPEPGHPAWIPLEWKPLMRGYWLVGMGQYVHGSLLMAPPLVIGIFAPTDDVGLFSMAFTLSTAINVVLSVTMGQVLQPIFAQMTGDAERQRAAFIRATGTIAAVAMPLCLLQAAVVGPAIRLLLPDRWDGAVTMAALLSAGQAFYFAVNPAKSLLKAQGRFTAFVAWQAVQLGVVLAAMFAAGALGGDRAAVAIAAVAGLYTVVWAPIGVWIGLRGTPGAALRSVMLFVRPLAATAVVLGPAAAALVALLEPGMRSDVWHLVALPVVTLALYPLALRIADPAAARECWNIVSVLRARVR